MIFIETKTIKPISQKRNYRNPIFLAKEYKHMIDSGKALNGSDLAQKIGVSKVTVNHFITLLKLDPELIKVIEEIGNPMPERYITERRLRSIVKLPSEEQRSIINQLINYS